MGEENNRDVSIEVGKRCVDIERQYGSQCERENSFVLYNELSSWEKKLYIDVCTQEARRGIGWWKMGIWRLKGVWRNIEQGICHMCNKKEGWSHILRCEETRSWREELVDKRFTNIEPEIGIRRIATNKDNDKLQKVGLYLSKYKEKWKRSVMKYEGE
jgi:hypothetical protein